MELTNGQPALKVVALGLVASLGAACGGGSTESGATSTRGQLTTYHTTDAAGAIPLRDRLGNAIAVGSTTPYSPERTCGGCHDFAVITQGYHFQQGKDVVADNYNPAKPWLLSDGMYGKW